MIIECHVMCWNEAETIHLTIKHYQQFCHHIIIWDNFSTDNTREIAKSMGCTVKTFGKEGELSDRAYIELKNECWKKKHNGFDRRDYVIVCDADEILDTNESILQEPIKRGDTIFNTNGFNVYSLDVPKDDWFERKKGVYDGNYSKKIIFDPKKINEINYSFGSHHCNPKGIVKYSDVNITLFHFKNIGGPVRLCKRNELYRSRLSQENLDRNFGHHYLESDEEVIKKWGNKYDTRALPNKIVSRDIHAKSLS